MKKKIVLMAAASIIALPALAVTLDRYLISETSPGMENRVSPAVIPTGRLPRVRMAAIDAAPLKAIDSIDSGKCQAIDMTPRFLRIRS